MAVKQHWCLLASEVFATIPEAERNRLASHIAEIPLKKRQTVYTPGETADTLYILDRGRVKISRLTEEGKELTLDILQPGDIFGELALGDDGVRGTNAEAMEDSVVCAIARRDFERLAADNPRLSFAITKWIGGRLLRIESRFENLVFKSVRSRLLAVLRELADTHGLPVTGGRKIDLPLSHQEIANLIGTTRETATLELNRLKRQDLLRTEGRAIVLTAAALAVDL